MLNARSTNYCCSQTTFTTPFAMILNTKQFQMQSVAFAKDDPSTSRAPSAIARPILFYLLWTGVHFLLADLYFNAILKSEFKADTAIALLGKELFGWTSGKFVESTANGYGYFKIISGAIGKTEALVVVAFAVLLIIAVKAALISIAGIILRVPVHFNTALKATAYALGTFVFSVSFCFCTARSRRSIWQGGELDRILYYSVSILLCRCPVGHANTSNHTECREN